MERTEVLTRLCVKMSQVGDRVFHNHEATDCFCGEKDVDRAVISSKVLAFVEKAIDDAVEAAQSPPKDEVSREELRETLAIAVALIKTQQADIAYLGSMLKAYVANTLGQFVN